MIRVLVAVALLSVALPVAAQECAPDFDGTRRATIQHEGVTGFWFARPIAECLLTDVRELRLVRERVGLLEYRLTLRDEQTAWLREMVVLSQQAEERATGTLTAAERRARRAEEERDAWHRSPVLWVVIGVAATVAVEVVAIVFIGGK